MPGLGIISAAVFALGVVAWRMDGLEGSKALRNLERVVEVMERAGEEGDNIAGSGGWLVWGRRRR